MFDEFRLSEFLVPQGWRTNLVILGVLSIAQVLQRNQGHVERRQRRLVASEILMLFFSMHLIGGVLKASDYCFKLFRFDQFLPSIEIASLGATNDQTHFVLKVLLATLLFLIYILIWDLCQYTIHRALHTRLLYGSLHEFHHRAVMSVTSSFRHSIPAFFFIFLFFNIPFAHVLHFSFPDIDLFIFWTAFALVSFALHSRIWLPFRRLGAVLMTPNHHLFHHAQATRFFNSNFGQIITLWDRLFGTYVDPWAVDEQTRRRIQTGQPITATNELFGFLGLTRPPAQS